MNLAAEDTEKLMECGTSLAEDVWIAQPATVPSLLLSQPQVKSNHSESCSSEATVEKSKAESVTATTVEEAWTKINQLRFRLAADVISDPPHPSASSAGSYYFPTFISPFERPKLMNNGDKTKKGTDKKTDTGSNTNNTNNNSKTSSSYQGMSIPLIYCDQTASQRPIRSIENYIRCISMPCYANTHTVSL